MTLEDYFSEWPGVLVHTIEPPKDVKRPTYYVVRPLEDMQDFQGEMFVKLDDWHWVIVQNHPATWSYEFRPRMWRERYFPHVFREGGKSSLTAEQQATVDFHKRVWEDYHDRKLTIDQARVLIADVGAMPTGPVIKAMIQGLAKGMTARKRPVIAKRENRTMEEVAMAYVRPVRPDDPA